jgi:hypothetical protein
MVKKNAFLLILNLSLIAAFFVGSAERLTEDVWTVRLLPGLPRRRPGLPCRGLYTAPAITD